MIQRMSCETGLPAARIFGIVKPKCTLGVFTLGQTATGMARRSQTVG
jgi:hypothetical protein